MDQDDAGAAFREFVAIIRALRTPGSGCPWDLQQDHRTLRPYVVEEAYEVLDAIDRGDDRGLCEELGDLLLQVVLHAQVAADRGAFTIAAVVRGVAEKMVRRHPHVFDRTAVSGADEVVRNWEAIKAAEERAAGAAPADAFDRIPESLPALSRAQRILAKVGPAGTTADDLAAARTGLDRLEQGAVPEAALGDVLLALCRLAGRLGHSAEDSLRGANRRLIEQTRAAGREGD